MFRGDAAYSLKSLGSNFKADYYSATEAQMGDDKSSTATYVGAGVAGAVAVAVIVCLVILLWKRGSFKKKQSTKGNLPAVDSALYANTTGVEEEPNVTFTNVSPDSSSHVYANNGSGYSGENQRSFPDAPERPPKKPTVAVKPSPSKQSPVLEGEGAYDLYESVEESEQRSSSRSLPGLEVSPNALYQSSNSNGQNKDYGNIGEGHIYHSAETGDRNTGNHVYSDAGADSKPALSNPLPSGMEIVKNDFYESLHDDEQDNQNVYSDESSPNNPAPEGNAPNVYSSVDEEEANPTPVVSGGVAAVEEQKEGTGSPEPKTGEGKKPAIHPRQPPKASAKVVPDASYENAGAGKKTDLAFPGESAYMEMVMSKDGILVAGLLEHVKNGKAHKMKKFNKEFEDIPGTVTDLNTCEGANPKYNAKNRYNNVIPYDDTRVRLKDCPSDYINASHITGFTDFQQYIAAQAPNRSSLEDFLQMIWQEGVSVVVMLNNVVENNKVRCQEYWPEGAGELRAGRFRVTQELQEQRPHFLIRHLHLTHLRSKETRTVRQYHYTQWPDYGVPVLTSGLVQLRQHVRRDVISGPLLVHCSAGVGRTGSFMALDMLLQCQGRLPITQCVTKLRQQRPFMVQTPLQYAFVHDALCETLVGGNTTLGCRDFTRWLSGSQGQHQMARQYEVLCTMVPEAVEGQQSAGFLDLKPITVAGKDKPSAVQVGHSGEELLLMWSGTKDVWEVVLQERVGTVVVLGKIQDLHVPDKGKSVGVSSRQISCVSEDEKKPGLLVKQLEMDEPQVYANVTTESNPAIQYLELEQPDSSLDSGRDISLFADALHVLMAARRPLILAASLAPGKAVLQVCSVAMATTRRLQEVDIYSAAKCLLAADKTLLPSLEEYRFIHQVVGKCLDESSTYANFH